MDRDDQLVDPRMFRAFCMRGEGRNNFVISAKGSQDGVRIVWRIAKHRKSGTVNVKPKCHLVNTYIERFISSFLSDFDLTKAKVVQILSVDMHNLSKIPSLPLNQKVETFDELKDETRYTREMSFFDHQKWPCLKYIGALEMPDATRIPRQLPFVYGPTITIEIKPKQGFFQTHPGINMPFCNNCILQIEKWKSATYEHMYDFCPLELYSGSRSKMHKALDSLIHDPHRNLRIFVDGEVIHDDTQQMSTDVLTQLLFPSGNADLDTLINAISCVLAGVSDDYDEFYLHDGSILAKLLNAQKIDSIGIVRAYNYLKQLSPKLQAELRKKTNLIDRYNDLSFLTKSDIRSLLERYLLSATMKDCSLMISLRLLDKLGVTEGGIVTALGGNGIIRIRGIDGKKLYFAYSIRIVDLDPKSAKRLENAYRRFISGVRYIRKNPGIHSPCVVLPPLPICNSS